MSRFSAIGYCILVFGWDIGLGWDRGPKVLFSIIIMAKNKQNKKKKISSRRKASSLKKSNKVVVLTTNRAARYSEHTGEKYGPGATALALRSKGNVAAAICLPHECSPVRFSSMYAEAPTALAAPYYLNSSDFTHGSSLEFPTVPDGTHFAAVFRDPLRAMVEHMVNHESKHWVYKAQFVDGNKVVSDTFVVKESSAVDFEEVNPLWWDDQYAGSSSYLHPHGNRLYAGSHKGFKGVWLDAAAGAACTVAFTLSAGDFVLKWRKLVGDQWIEQTQTTSTSSSLSLSVLSSGYYSFAVQLTATGNRNLSVTMDCYSDCMAHHPMPHITEKQAVVQTIRTNAVSLMLSCEASKLNAAGRACGYQAPAGLDWTGLAFATDPFDTISGSNGAKTLPLEKGIYGFLKPTTQDDFDMKEPFSVSNGVVVGADYDLLPKHDYLVVIATTPQTSDNSYPGGNTYTTACWGVEFRTNDVWFVCMPPAMSSAAFARDIEAIKNVDQWHENPFHFSDIFNFLKGAGKSVLKYSPTVLSLLAGLPTPYKPQLSAAAGLAEGVRDLLL